MLFLPSNCWWFKHASINRVQRPVSEDWKGHFFAKRCYWFKIHENIINVSKAEIFIIFQNKTVILYCQEYTPFKHLVQSICIVEGSHVEPQFSQKRIRHTCERFARIPHTSVTNSYRFGTHMWIIRSAPLPPLKQKRIHHT